MSILDIFNKRKSFVSPTTPNSIAELELHWAKNDMIHYVDSTCFNRNFFFDTLLSNGYSRELLLAADGETFETAFIRPGLVSVSYELYQGYKASRDCSSQNVAYAQAIADAEWDDEWVYSLDLSVGFWHLCEFKLTEIYMYNQTHEEKVTMPDTIRAYFSYLRKNNRIDEIIDSIYHPRNLDENEKIALFDKAESIVLDSAQRIWQDYMPFMAWTARHDYYHFFSHEKQEGRERSLEVKSRFTSYQVLPRAAIWNRYEIPIELKNNCAIKEYWDKMPDLQYHEYDEMQDCDYYI